MGKCCGEHKLSEKEILKSFFGNSVGFLGRMPLGHGFKFLLVVSVMGPCFLVYMRVHCFV